MINKAKNVSLVLTSCNRFDLLEKTLASFFEKNTYPIEQYVIIEDSHNIQKLQQTIQKFPNIDFTILYNDPQIGQMKSIERAYSIVTSTYIFHCEDDWLFYRSGFIEDSFKVLESDDKIITVWLREQNDTNNHPVESKIYLCVNDPNTSYQLMSENYPTKNGDMFWHGFTLNPGLRRLADHGLIEPIGTYRSELDINEAFFKIGFKAAIFKYGYLKHLGKHRGIRYKFNANSMTKDLSVILRKFKASIINLFN